MFDVEFKNLVESERDWLPADGTVWISIVAGEIVIEAFVLEDMSLVAFQGHNFVVIFKICATDDASSLIILAEYQIFTKSLN